MLQRKKNQLVNIDQFLTTENLYFITGADKIEAIKNLFHLVVKHEKDNNIILEELLKRELLMSTALGRGVAFPHIGTPSVSQLFLGIGILDKAVNWQSFDGQNVDIIVLVLFPLRYRNEYLNIVAQLSAVLRVEENRDKIRSEKNPKLIVDLFTKGKR